MVLIGIIYLLPNKYPIDGRLIHPDTYVAIILFTLGTYSTFWTVLNVLFIENVHACWSCKMLVEAKMAFKNCFHLSNAGNLNCHNAKLFYELATVPHYMRDGVNWRIHGLEEARAFSYEFKKLIMGNCREFPALLQVFAADVSHAANENGAAVWVADQFGLPRLVKVESSLTPGGADYVNKDASVQIQVKTRLGSNPCQDKGPAPMGVSTIVSSVNQAVPRLVSGTTHLVVVSAPGTQEGVLAGIRPPAGVKVITINNDNLFDTSKAGKQFDVLSEMFPTPESFVEANKATNQLVVDKLAADKAVANKFMSKWGFSNDYKDSTPKR